MFGFKYLEKHWKMEIGKWNIWQMEDCLIKLAFKYLSCSYLSIRYEDDFIFQVPNLDFQNPEAVTGGVL